MVTFAGVFWVSMMLGGGVLDSRRRVSLSCKAANLCKKVICSGLAFTGGVLAAAMSVGTRAKKQIRLKVLSLSGVLDAQKTHTMSDKITIMVAGSCGLGICDKWVGGW